MAACNTMAELIQAYVDGQLGPDDASLVEMHVAECPDCAIQLSELHDVTTLMVEKLAPARVSTTFVDRVVEALPHMYERATVDALAEINKRAKRQTRLHQLAQMVPYAGAAVLTIAMVLLYAVWPEEPMGVVAKVTNPTQVLRASRQDSERTEVSIGDIISANDTFITDPESRLILALKTAEIKLNGGAILRVAADREVELIKGELCADVTSTGAPFHVKLDSGDITVMGTRFVVHAQEDKTVVTVAEGNVLFKKSGGYSEIGAGRQSVCFAGGTPGRAKPVEVAAITKWADDFVVTPDDLALAGRQRTNLPLRRYAELPRTHGEVVPTQTVLFHDLPETPYVIRYVAVRRDAFGPNPGFSPASRFAIHVCDENMKKLATIEESYSVFDGTTGDAILALDYPVTMDGVFHVLFQPYVQSGLSTYHDARVRACEPLPSPSKNVSVLSQLPTTEGI